MNVAIKSIDLETISTSFDDILLEVQTMRLCLNDNVLKCHCSFVARDQLWLVTEYMDKGSCCRFILSILVVSMHRSIYSLPIGP